ncbi:partial Colicin I receptor, partial [Geobacteraceae bacterium]
MLYFFLHIIVRSARRTALLVVALLFCAVTAQGSNSHEPDLTDLSLEELMGIEVTSVFRKPQSVADSAAAVYVVTREDIRRSGVTNIADALRMVPGVQVARHDNNEWAVSVRGLNSRYFSKLLVLIDGRTVYGSMMNGIAWEWVDTLIEDVERIEVIRGPGGSLWGANAVNGIINIITAHAAQTQGFLVTAGGGTEERA